MVKRNGQIWIETVIYTLIGLALIGIILAIITPKINESKDRIMIEQATGALNNFGEKIREVLDRPIGNKRVVEEFFMRRGEFWIDGENERIAFLFDDIDNPYSEPNESIKSGWVSILTHHRQKNFNVELSLDYQNITDIQYDGDDLLKQFGPASVPYAFSVESLGNGTDRIVNIKEISR